MGHVRITPLDGKIPNLALMHLAAWHRSRGDEVHFRPSIERTFDEPEYDKVYGSAIFTTTQKKIALFRQHFPEAIVGGTGSGNPVTVEDIVGDGFDEYDYMSYTEKVTKLRKNESIERPWSSSIGFTQRGCRLKCGFCVVPKKEGKNRSVRTINEIWRGSPWPKNILLLDNDFFGQELWRERIAEIRDGKFKVCFSQGINVRKVDDESAEALASIEYRDGKFKERRLYTAWDNIGDEAVFFRGVDTLERHGVKPSNLMAYMLIGYDKRETWERIHYRFDRMVERGIEPFIMVFDPKDVRRKKFQRYVNMGLYRLFPFSEYDAGHKTKNQMPGQMSLFDAQGPGFLDPVDPSWSDGDDEMLAEMAVEMGVEGNAVPVMAERLGRTAEAVEARLRGLGLLEGPLDRAA